MLNGLDLFSGIGGLSIALAPWVRPVAYCEFDRYATALLLSRMVGGDLPTAPIWDDVRTFNGNMLGCGIDIIYGGFPCQDISLAGARKGLAGERSGLFYEAIRLVRECKPKFVFLENVGGIRKYVPTVRGELEALGYDCRDGFLSAAEVGANHIRNRWWLLAHSNGSNGRLKQKSGTECESSTLTRNDGPEKSLANTNSTRLERHWNGAERGASEHAVFSFPGGWEVEPDVGRVANGIPFRVDRIKGLGNSVVPAQAREAFKILMGIQ